MNYEKLYKDALEKARLLNNGNDIDVQNGTTICEYIFPELKELEDERIRKDCIKYLDWEYQHCPLNEDKMKIEKCVAWLEKQGEQMSGPRYSILDKLIEADDIYQMSVNDAMVEEAKNKAIEALSKLEISKLLGLEKQGEQKSTWSVSDFRTWQYIVSDVLTKHDGIGQYLDDGFCKKIAKYMQEEWSKKLSLGQNPVWSEEDEIGWTNTMIMIKEGASLHFIKKDIKKTVDWLKSLKKRMKGE